jgi:hypothetical protein
MPISNMQQARQMYNQGGYADMGLMAPRQGYGFGSFVKKAVRGVKKIAKSPLGKAAIAGAIGFGIPGTSFGGLMGRSAGSMFGGAKGIFGNSGGIGSIFGNAGKFSKVGDMFRKDGAGSALSYGKLGLGALGAASLAPLLMGGNNDDVEDSVEQLDPMATVQSAKNYYSGQGNAGAGLNFMPQKKYVNQNFYAADGGRAGYANGQLVSPSNNGFRPGYAGEDGILSTIKNFPKNLKSGLGQIFSGETEAYLGGDQKGMNEAVVADMWGQTLPKETIDMIIDANKRGVDIDTIISLTGADASDVTGVIDMLNQGVESKAYGGRAGYAMGGDIEDEEEFIRSGASQRRIMPQTFLAMGGGAGEAQAEQMLQAEFIKYKNRGGELSFQEFVQAVMQQQQAQGMQQPTMAANGGRMGYAEGGIMDAEAAEMIDMGGQEKDYRDEGGFVAMGGEERADDVPARLSKNEFVFTADAVRQAGGGDIDRGSEVMQNMMDNLEQGGQISQGSQGLGGEEEFMEEPDGAQAMYEQQQALQSRMA